MSIGILAYGSLISNPGEMLDPLITEKITGVTTPFRIEFARSSRIRDGAPTLIPVDSGGAQMKGTVLVLDSTVSLAQARTLLWRRETGQEHSTERYARPENLGANNVLVETAHGLKDIDVETVLFTKIGANIQPLSAERLATLAIRSAKAKAGAKGKDGISYLKTVISDGVITPLLPGYRETILQMTGAKNLDEAHRAVRLMAADPC